MRRAEFLAARRAGSPAEGDWSGVADALTEAKAEALWGCDAAQWRIEAVLDRMCGGAEQASGALGRNAASGRPGGRG